MQRYFSNKKEAEYLFLDKDDIFHITKVMRQKEKEKLEIVYEEKVYICCIENVNNEIKFKIEKEGINEVSLPTEIILAIPLLKEQKLDYIFQKATELGVDKFIPIITERSVIKIDFKKEEKKLQRWTKICKEAAEQSKRTKIPEILPVKKLKELETINALKIVCSTTEKQNSIKNTLNNNKNCDKILLVIGPEGGLSDKEEQLLVNSGFIKATLGSRIMRAETVPLFIMSIINYQYME